MKILTAMPLVLLSTIAIASENQELKQLGTLEQGKASYKKAVEWSKNNPGKAPTLNPIEDYAIFGKEGLPRPGSGVHVMPLKQMHYDKSQVLKIQANVSALDNHGYIKTYNANAKNLLNFKQTAVNEYANNSILHEQSTHLRHKSSELKMAYDYKELPTELVNEVIGFAPECTFIKNGWTGSVEFFTPKNIDGICAYHEVNIKLTGGSANLAKEIISRQVNNKITIVETSGNSISGYEYNIEWWDNNFRHVLECASKTFTPEIKNEAVKLAVNIDAR
jgi:hypothetical protein